MSFGVIINPGTEACQDTKEKNAIENIKQFIQDCEVLGLKWKRKKKLDYGDGRYAFIVKKTRKFFSITSKTIKWEIQMPGLPLKKVRYLGNPDQNIWNYPRLYVDGSSWVWKYAIIKKQEYEELLNEAQQAN